MSIELSKEDRAQAIASIERYFLENMEEKIGNIAAGGLLGFVLEEIGPSIYKSRRRCSRTAASPRCRSGF